MNEEKRTGMGETPIAPSGHFPQRGKQERTPEVIGAEIRMYVDAGRRVTLLCGIEIGRRLCEAKDMLPHGEWLPWLSRETDFSDRKAQLYMQAFREYGAKQLWIFEPETNAKTFADLPISKALALLSVPESEREAFAAEVGAESLSTRELQEAIRERDEALKREKAAREELLQADEGHALAVAEIQEQLDQARREKATAEQEARRAAEGVGPYRERAEAAESAAAELRAQIKELESRPVEVAVERDEQAIQDAAREARAKAVAEAAERETAIQKLLEAALKKAEKAEKAAQKAKETAEKAGQDDKAELAKAAQEAAAAQQEAEELRKKLKLADPTATEFKAYFEQVQQLWGGLIGVIGRAEPELGEKLKKAARALLEKFGESLKETAGENRCAGTSSGASATFPVRGEG